jgi:hypothetical protein
MIVSKLTAAPAATGEDDLGSVMLRIAVDRDGEVHFVVPRRFTSIVVSSSAPLPKSWFDAVCGWFDAVTAMLPLMTAA